MNSRLRRHRRHGWRGAHVARSTARLYGALLWLYPPSLRQEYGGDMLQLFRDTLRREITCAGPPGAVRAWGPALADLAVSLPREWRRELSNLRAWRSRARRHVSSDRINGLVVGHTAIGQIREQRRRMRNEKFEKFTERARKVLSLAQEEAQRFNHNYIGTEHLLLGLVREEEGVAAKVLSNLDVDLVKVRSAVEFIIGRGDRIVLGEIGLTPRAKRVIELAVDEARRLNHHYIGTEHLLLGMLREGEGIAAGVLESLGVDLEKVRSQTIQILNQGGHDTSTTSRASAQRRPRPDPGQFTERTRGDNRWPTLGQITLLCRDISATMAFYTQHFDASAIRTLHAADSVEWELRLPGGGPVLKLRAWPEGARPDVGGGITLDIWVADVDLMWRTLKDSGVSDLSELRGGLDERNFTVSDPDGRPLYIYTRNTQPGV